MDGRKRLAQAGVLQSSEPAGFMASLIQMQAQRLYQHHMGQMLGDQRSAWPTLAKFFAHPCHRPAQRHLVHLFSNVNYGRHHLEKCPGMASGNREPTADKKQVAAAVDGHRTAGLRGRENCLGIKRLQRQIAGQPEGPAAR